MSAEMLYGCRSFERPPQAVGWQVPVGGVWPLAGALRIMRPDTWYGQAMAFDKKKFQARLQKMSADEIRKNLPFFDHKKKPVAIDELAARAQDEELKALSQKNAALRIGVIYAVVIAVCALIALIYFTQL